MNNWFIVFFPFGLIKWKTYAEYESTVDIKFGNSHKNNKQRMKTETKTRRIYKLL